MDLGLSGRRAVVMGATRGIGRAVAESLVAEGASVAICARDAAAMAQAVEELGGSGGTVVGRALDVADTDALRGWIDDASAEMGGLDVFRLERQRGAAVPTSGGRRSRSTSWRPCEAPRPQCHTSSATGGHGAHQHHLGGRDVPRANGLRRLQGGSPHYAMNLAAELAPRGVRFNSVMPGPVSFPGGAWETIERDQPEFFDSVMRALPMARMANPRDVADAVTFLASDAASYVTGATLVVDGCFTRRVQF